MSSILSACGGGSTAPDAAAETPEQPANAGAIEAATLKDIQISLEVGRVVNGLSSKAYAAGVYSDNSSEDLSSAVQWASSDVSVASVDSKGEITGLQSGSTVISATIDGISASTALHVDEASLLALTITPNNVELAAGLTQTFSVRGEFNNGDRYDVTALASWSSSDSAIVTVSSSTGMATAVSPGSASITASLGGLSTVETVSVSAATLEHIEISADQTRLPAGTELQINASGIFSDDSVLNLSDQVSWQSSVENVAAIDNSGRVSALSKGTTQISLSYLGESARLEITVDDARLVGIDISPGNPRIIQNSKLQLHATARYSDGATLDVTEQATWVSGDESLLVVGNSVLDRGRVQTLAVGSADVTAYFEGGSQQTTITVTEASLTNIEISPVVASVALGTRQRFSVTGHYDDGSSRLITEQVNWSVSDSGVASSDGAAGVFRAAGTGSSQVVVLLDGSVAFATLTVTPATLESISISPQTIDIAAGYQAQFVATGHYSDNSSQDISDTVVWQSTHLAAASISNAEAAKGMLHAIGAGASTISARLNGVTSESAVTVTAAELTGITIQSVGNEMIVGQTQTLGATGHYSDDSSLDLSDAVAWSSSDESLAVVSNANADKGLVTALSQGALVITASLDGVDGSSAVTLNKDPNAVASLSLSAAPNVILNNGVDTTTISIRLQAADANGSVADNTPIEVEIIEGSNHTLQTVYSENGQASVDVSSTYEGYIQIRAGVANGISNSAVLISTSDFANVIARIGLVSVQYDNNTILSGSWFAALMRNLSNRTFDLEQYEFSNGSNTNSYPVTGVNSGQLEGGEQGTVLVTFGNDQVDEGVTSVLSLSEAGTGLQFSFTTVFTQPE